jgi:hypothetical protein
VQPQAQPEFRLPNAADLLALWDQARSLTMARRAAMLVALACPALSSEAIAALPLGVRDALLIAWRRLFFGSEIEGIASCPRCGEQVKLELPFTTLALEQAGAFAAGDREHVCEADGWHVRYRVPNCGDAVALAETKGGDGLTLIARCILAAKGPGETGNVVPQPILSVLAESISGADPYADIVLDLACPACAHRWSAPFDPVAFVWREIGAWARRTLSEVAALARAFGWREADLLVMTPRRRADYLELASV